MIVLRSSSSSSLWISLRICNDSFLRVPYLSLLTCGGNLWIPRQRQSQLFLQLQPTKQTTTTERNVRTAHSVLAGPRLCGRRQEIACRSASRSRIHSVGGLVVVCLAQQQSPMQAKPAESEAPKCKQTLRVGVS